MFRSIIEWYEALAERDAREAIAEMGYRAQRTTVYNDNSPLTLDRILALSYKYLMGSRRFLNQPRYIYFRSQDSRNKNKAETLLSVLIWFSSGIAFQHGLALGLATVTNASSKLFEGIGTIFGGIGGSVAGLIAGIYNQFTNPEAESILVAIKTGAIVGSTAVAQIGSLVGYFAGIIPGFIVGSTVGVAIGLGIGAISVVASAAKLGIVLKDVSLIVFNPYAWARGANHVGTSISNAFRHSMNFIRDTYNEQTRIHNAPDNTQTQEAAASSAAMLELSNPPSITHRLNAARAQSLSITSMNLNSQIPSEDSNYSAMFRRYLPF